MPEVEVFRRELRRHALPPRYIERACREWQAHIADATAELEAAGHAPADARREAVARMGCPHLLAEQARLHCADASLPLRHPVLVPLSLSLAAFLAIAASALALLAFVFLPQTTGALRTLNEYGRLLLPALTAVTVIPLLRRKLGGPRPVVLCLAMLTVLSVTADIRVEAHDGRLTKVVLRLLR